MTLNLASLIEVAAPPWFTVRRVGDRADVWISGEILPDAGNLIAELDGVADVTLNLDCIGGDAVTALAIYESLKDRTSLATITLAASAAVIIALAARRRLITPDGRFMVHKSRSVVFNTAAGLRAAADLIDACDEKHLAILQERTGRSNDEVRQLLSGPDVWFTAGEAVAAGLCHEIIPAPANELAPTGAVDMEATETDDSEFLFDLLRATGRLRVKNRRAFLRELQVFFCNDQHLTETKS